MVVPFHGPDARVDPAPMSQASNVRLLEDAVAAISTTRIVDHQIVNPERFVFGNYDVGAGLVTLNVPLLRVLVALHELAHVVRPTWNERTVRARSSQLLQMLTDDGVATVDRALVAAIRAGR